jgi:signal peptidase I
MENQPTQINDQNDSNGQDIIDAPGSFRRTLNFLGELLHVVVISLAIILPIRYFLIQPFYVKGASMEPNFHDHEYLIIDEISYRFSPPERGDIVVFRYPDDPRQFFIKRIVGLPGERIEISRGGVYLYNEERPEGFHLDESFYLVDPYTSGEKVMDLSSDEYFLMGDNRSASMDSRAFGSVPKRFIVGKVLLRGWPPDKVKFFTEEVGYDSSL